MTKTTSVTSAADMMPLHHVRAPAATQISAERLGGIVKDVVDAMREVILKYQVSLAEYNALKAWITELGQQDQGWMFCDIYLDSAVEQVMTAKHKGSGTTIEGPYYLHGAPLLGSHCTLPMRADEAGVDFVLKGQVQGLNGEAIPGAVLDLWQCDQIGFYSNIPHFPGVPEWNLRGRVVTDQQGRFEVKTKRPAPYSTPAFGALGKLIKATQWEPHRPAHIHFKVYAPGYEGITGQLYFEDDPLTAIDLTGATKSSLIVSVDKRSDGSQASTYQFRLERSSQA